jgi:hypothetical protein
MQSRCARGRRRIRQYYLTAGREVPYGFRRVTSTPACGTPLRNLKVSALTGLPSLSVLFYSQRTTPFDGPIRQ